MMVANVASMHLLLARRDPWPDHSHSMVAGGLLEMS
jgi:hypothetical protein